MRSIHYILLVLLLAGCSSAELNVHHYLLHIPEKPEDSPKSQGKRIVTFNKVSIADYLRQSSLVVRLANHQLYYSPQDLWAEPLDTSFQKALLQDLNKTEHTEFVTAVGPKSSNSQATLEISIEHFHATDSGNVVLSGYYWVVPNPLTTQLSEQEFDTPHDFHFTSNLDKDGYPHTVEKLRELVATLAEKINQNMTTTSGNKH